MMSMYTTSINTEALKEAAKMVPPLFSPEVTLEIAERIIRAYLTAELACPACLGTGLDTEEINPVTYNYSECSVCNGWGYSQYPDIATYINEPSEKQEIRAAIRSKKQVIQMFTREILELEALL